MPKIIYILVIIAIVPGCYVKRAGEAITPVTKMKPGIEIGEVKKQNLTNSDFNIAKAEIEISNNGESQKLLGSLKFKKSGSYLVSFKTRTGIEAARIFITKDTILINDRLKKRLFYGSADYLKEKYGISGEAIPLIFGDFIESAGKEEQVINCLDKKNELSGVIISNRITYTIDCHVGKIIKASIDDEQNSGKILFLYNKFKKATDINYPGYIEFSDKNRETIIRIKIDRIEFGGEVKTDFIPGNNYEKILLK